VIGIAFWRERVLDRGTFFLLAAERRSVSVFFPAGFLLRAVFFFAILRSLSLGSHRARIRIACSFVALTLVSLNGWPYGSAVNEMPSTLAVDAVQFERRYRCSHTFERRRQLLRGLPQSTNQIIKWHDASGRNDGPRRT
jgi:hypothetical protein